MINSSDYINANKNTCAINAIRKLINEDKSIAHSIEDYKIYLGQFLPFVDEKKMRTEVLKTLDKCRTVPGLIKVLDADRKKIVSPMYRTTLDYIEEMIGVHTLTEIAQVVDRDLRNMGR